MNNDITAHGKPGVVYTAGPELWQRVPEFRYEAPSARDSVFGLGLTSRRFHEPADGR